MLPRVLELQISANTLGNLILNRARTQVFCVPDFVVAGQDVMIDHVEFENDVRVRLAKKDDAPGAGVLEQRVRIAGGNMTKFASRTIQIDLSVKIFAKWLAAAMDPESVTPYLLDGVSAILTLELSIINSPAQLCVAIVDVQSDLLDLEMAGAALEFLHGLAPVCLPFDVSAFASNFGPAKVQNVVLAAESRADEMVTAVALRLELGNTPRGSKQFWKSFIDEFKSTLREVGPDWNVLIDAQLLVDYMAEKVSVAVNGMEFTTMEDRPHGIWVTTKKAGAIAMTVAAHYSNRAYCANDIGMTITVVSEFDFSNGTLKEHRFVDWNLTDSDVALCGIDKLGLPGLLVGLALGGTLGAALGAVIGSMVGAVVVGIAASVFSGSKSLKDEEPEPNCKVVDDHHMKCVIPLTLPVLDFGAGVSAVLTGTHAQSVWSGLLLGGTASIAEVGKPFFEISEPEEVESWGLIGSCFNWRGGYSFSVELTGSGGAPSGPPTRLCAEPEVLEDPDGVITYTRDPLLDGLPVTINFELNLSGDEPYFVHPYRPILFVRTSSGSRAIRLPELLKPTTAQTSSFGLAVKKANTDCYLSVVDSVRFNPHWLVDPGPDDDLNIWEVMVATPMTQAPFSVHTNEGVELARAVYGSRLAHLSIAMSGAGGRLGTPTQLVLSRRTGPLHGLTALAARVTRALGDRLYPSARMLTTQQILHRRSSWSAQGAVRRVTTGRYGSEPCAIIGTADAVELISLNIPTHPALRVLVRGARGALPLNGGLLTWGKHGLAYDNRQILLEPVEHVVLRNNRVYVSMPHEAVVLDTGFERLSSVRIDGAGSCVVAGNRLIVVRHNGLEVYTADTRAVPHRVGRLALKGIRGLESPPLAGLMPYVLVEHNEDGFTLLALDGNRLSVAGRYATRPWFAGAARIDGILVRPGADESVDVFAAGKRAIRKLGA